MIEYSLKVDTTKKVLKKVLEKLENNKLRLIAYNMTICDYSAILEDIDGTNYRFGIDKTTNSNGMVRYDITLYLPNGDTFIDYYVWPKDSLDQLNDGYTADNFKLLTRIIHMIKSNREANGEELLEKFLNS